MSSVYVENTKEDCDLTRLLLNKELIMLLTSQNTGQVLSPVQLLCKYTHLPSSPCQKLPNQSTDHLIKSGGRELSSLREKHMHPYKTEHTMNTSKPDLL